MRKIKSCGWVSKKSDVIFKVGMETGEMLTFADGWGAKNKEKNILPTFFFSNE